MQELETAKMWECIKEYIKKIKDTKARNVVQNAMIGKFYNAFGFCPDNKEYKPQKVELEPWQEAFLKRIKSSVEYGVFVVDEQVEKEAKTRMRDFIRKGGKYSDLPEDLQNQHIAALYISTLLDEIRFCKDQLDFLEKNQKNCLQGKNGLI